MNSCEESTTSMQQLNLRDIDTSLISHDQLTIIDGFDSLIDASGINY